MFQTTNQLVFRAYLYVDICGLSLRRSWTVPQRPAGSVRLSTLKAHSSDHSYSQPRGFNGILTGFNGI